MEIQPPDNSGKTQKQTTQMKTAVVTLPLHTNCGGILQAYALQKVLTGMGHDTVLARFADPLLHRLYHPLAVWLKQNGWVSYTHGYPLTKREKQTISRNTSKFVAQHIKYTPPVSGKRLSRMGFGTFVAGSDQIWRHYDTRYFLGFLPDGSDSRRISYAASFGTDKWPLMPDQTEEARRLVSRFDAVSVREDSGAELCRKYFGVDPEIMPDPAFLLEREHYAALAAEEIRRGEPSVMCYILDPAAVKSNVAESVCTALSLPLNEVAPRSKPGPGVPIRDCVWPSVEEWLAGFANAEFVVTDSFHGTVFSLLFNKPFVAIANEERGMARFRSLLRKFGLQERLISAGEKLPPGLLRRKIDFGKVNAAIAGERQRAFRFLDEALMGKRDEK